MLLVLVWRESSWPGSGLLEGNGFVRDTGQSFGLVQH